MNWYCCTISINVIWPEQICPPLEFKIAWTFRMTDYNALLGWYCMTLLWPMLGSSYWYTCQTRFHQKLAYSDLWEIWSQLIPSSSCTMPLFSPTSIMLTLCMTYPLRPINLGCRDCKHKQLDWFLAQTLEIVETQCSKGLDGYHLKIEDLCINIPWFLNVEMA